MKHPAAGIRCQAFSGPAVGVSFHSGGKLMIQDPVGGTRESYHMLSRAVPPAAGRGFLQARVSMITDKQECESRLAEVNILLRIFPELEHLGVDEVGKRWCSHDVAIVTDSYCLQCGRFIPGRTGENQVCLVCRLEDGPGLQFD
jgi:hypothetical protein